MRVTQCRHVGNSDTTHEQEWKMGLATVGVTKIGVKQGIVHRWITLT